MMPGDDVLMMPGAHRVEVFTGTGRRRRWSAEAKARIVAESHATSVGEVSDRYGICKTQLFTWRRDARRADVGEVTFAPVTVEDRDVEGDGLIEVEFGSARVRIGQLWAYARDDRPWGGADPPAAVYVYATDRTAGQPIKHLAGFKGVLQVDGYGGYRPLAERGEVRLAFCWAHLRRPFYELAAAGPAPIAGEMLERIKALYAIEADLRGRPAQDRAAARQARTSPLLTTMEAWLRATLQTVSQKGKLAEAIRYALARWDGLTRFVDDGTIEIDSNVVERSIRPIALTRKNALFAGSDGGAEHWAVVASLIETCKLNAVDPQAYLGATLARIVHGHPKSRIDELLPWAYAG